MIDDVPPLLFWPTCFALVVVPAGCGSGGAEVFDSTRDASTIDRDTETPSMRDTGTGTEETGVDGGEAGPTCTYVPDSCPPDENCYGTPERERWCAPYDPESARGDDCKRLSDCGNGERCLSGTCRAICDPERPEKYGCDEPRRCLNFNDAYDWGACLEVEDRCRPWPDSTCDDPIDNCYRLRRGYRCRPYDANASVGDSCRSATDCNDRQRCVEGRCRSLCDPDGSAGEGCDEGATCQTVQGRDGSTLPWGVCFEQTNACETWPSDSCERGDNCYRLGGGTQCRAYDPEAAIGDACSVHWDCNAGQACTTLPDEARSRCRAKCDGEHPCSKGLCRSSEGTPYGVCVAE